MEYITIDLQSKLEGKISGISSSLALEVMQYAVEEANKIVSEEFEIDFSLIGEDQELPVLEAKALLELAKSNYFLDQINEASKPQSYRQGLLSVKYGNSDISTNEQSLDFYQKSRQNAISILYKYFAEDPSLIFAV